jgi:hypothetical protein
MALIIDGIGGNCPVQGEGTFDGKPFYFRARHESWSIGVGGEPVGNPEWYASKDWGDGPFKAGWMPVETAREIIADQYREYVKQTKEKT